MNTVLLKNTARLIRKSLGRFLAIVCILALGVGFFSGLTVTKSTMRQTADAYVKDSVLYDFKLISTLGFTQEEVEALGACQGVRLAVGGYFCDVLERTEKGDRVLTALSLNDEMNLPQVTVGRLPQGAGECLADARVFSADRVGTKLLLSDANEESTLSSFSQREYTVVGLCNSPEYMHMQRGTSKLGNGKVEGFVYLKAEDFTAEYYSCAYVKMTEDPTIFTEAYDEAMEALQPVLSQKAEECVVHRFDSLVADAEKEIADGEAELADGKTKLEQGKQELADGQLRLEEGRQSYNDGLAQLEDAKKQWEEQSALWEEQRLQLEDAKEQLKAAKESLFAMQYLDPSLLSLYLIELGQQEEQILQGEAALTAAKEQLDLAEQSILENEKTLAQSLLDLEQGEKELEEARSDIAQGEQELAEASQKLEQAKADLAALEAPEIFSLTRYENVGFATFESDSTIVEGIAKVFPVLFFLVAALICSTTMNKMVENARTEMGTLKALGYSNAAVVSQYLLYALLAALLGTLIGFFAVSRLFPWVIWIAYTMLYDFTDSLVYVFDPVLMAISFGAALLCSVGVAYVSCRGSLRELPASLIRPKAPKAGKRILLERIPFFWKRLGFFGKVSLRNLFRYKKRFVMMVLGIGGCMALLCVGFGLRDSIKNLVDYQYGEIAVYDAAFTFRDSMKDSWEDFLADTKEQVSRGVLLYEDTVELPIGERSKELRMIVAEEGLQDLVLLHNKGTPLAYPQTGQALLNRKMVEQGGYAVGDSLTLTLSEGKTITVTLAGVCESYVSNYVYINAQSYREAVGEEPSWQTAYLCFGEGADHHAAAARCREAAEVANVSLTLDMKTNVGNMMASMDYVILLVVLCAAALALVVLFNLGNINIMERQREIATLKVLGFQLSEVNRYVFRENLVLSVIGTLLGVPLGKVLHAFVMGEIRIDLVSFEVRIAPESMLICAVLTMAFTLLVNLILIPKLRAIEMATSLKSVE